MEKGKEILNKAAKVITKIVEIIHWAGAVATAAGFALLFFSKGTLQRALESNQLPPGWTVEMKGFEIMLGPDGQLNFNAVFIMLFTAFILMVLYAMVFRNAYLILQTAEGRTKFAQGATPFQEDVVRMFREIGIFLIAIPFVELVMSLVAKAMSVGLQEIDLDMSTLVIGLLILSLSSYFAYGMELEKDVEGLV